MHVVIGRVVIALVVALVVALPQCGAAQARQAIPPQVIVSAAVSLADVLQRLARVYEARTGERVVLNLGPSNTLARQIEAGARVDLFISADEAQMDVAAPELLPGTRVRLLSNQLSIVVPDDRATRMASPRDLLDARIRRIAIGDPTAVPAGVYAREYLRRAGLWTSLERKLIPVGSVRLALAAVESGAVDAAIVYKTDVATASRAREAFVVPAADGPAIVYPAAVVRTGANPDGARRLLGFLQGAEATAIFMMAGFLPPGGRER
jgi:molybdate transport system substrate-binding protein